MDERVTSNPDSRRERRRAAITAVPTANVPIPDRDCAASRCDSRRFPTGRLEIRAADGSRVALDTADGDGDPATVAPVLTVGDESETQGMRWEARDEIPRLDGDRADDKSPP